MTVAVRSFAKINLGLYIGAPRPDGFHDLRTVYQTIALHDVIRVSVGRGNGIEILCDDPRVPLDSSNTCYRIAERVMVELGAKGRVSIEIEKRLPMQGGLGGASSNGVATMIALERALKRGMLTSGAKARKNKVSSTAALKALRHPKSKAEAFSAAAASSAAGALSEAGVLSAAGALSAVARLRIAADVGSDLPLFLVGGTVLGVDRGEEVYPLPDLPSLPLVIVVPEVGVSTARAFADWDLLLKSGAALRAAWTGDDARPSPNMSASLRSGRGPERSRRNASVPRLRLTPLAPSDRLSLAGCALSAWLTGLENSGSPNTGASAQGGSRAGKLLSDLVRTGIENDFERVVFSQYPELRDIKGALERAGAKYASLSGSGSTLYGLFESMAAAAQAGLRLRRQGLTAVATRTFTRSQYWKQSLVVSR